MGQGGAVISWQELDIVDLTKYVLSTGYSRTKYAVAKSFIPYEDIFQTAATEVWAYRDRALERGAVGHLYLASKVGYALGKLITSELRHSVPQSAKGGLPVFDLKKPRYWKWTRKR